MMESTVFKPVSHKKTYILLINAPKVHFLDHVCTKCYQTYTRLIEHKSRRCSDCFYGRNK